MIAAKRLMMTKAGPTLNIQNLVLCEDDFALNTQGSVVNSYLSTTGRFPEIAGRYRQNFGGNIPSGWYRSEGFLQPMNPAETTRTDVSVTIFPELRDMIAGETLTCELTLQAGCNVPFGYFLRGTYNAYYNITGNVVQLYNTPAYTVAATSSTFTSVTNPIKITDNQTSIQIHEFTGGSWVQRLNFNTTTGNKLVSSAVSLYQNFYRPQIGKGYGGIKKIKFGIN